MDESQRTFGLRESRISDRPAAKLTIALKGLLCLALALFIPSIVRSLSACESLPWRIPATDIRDLIDNGSRPPSIADPIRSFDSSPCDSPEGPADLSASKDFNLTGSWLLKLEEGARKITLELNVEKEEKGLYLVSGAGDGERVAKGRAKRVGARLFLYIEGATNPADLLEAELFIKDAQSMEGGCRMTDPSRVMVSISGCQMRR